MRRHLALCHGREVILSVALSSVPDSEGNGHWDDRAISERQMPVSRNVLETIGNTSLVELRRVVPADCARIVVKVEGETPTGSMKDRVALAMIGRPEADGRLKAGDTVVEYTGGSTGASLALVCAAKGYRLRVVTSTAFSEEKLTQTPESRTGFCIDRKLGGGGMSEVFLAIDLSLEWQVVVKVLSPKRDTSITDGLSRLCIVHRRQGARRRRYAAGDTPDVAKPCMEEAGQRVARQRGGDARLCNVGVNRHVPEHMPL